MEETLYKHIVIIAAFLLFAFTVAAAFATEPGPDLVILYTADTIGHVEPCG
jgi:hypothetical protein